MITSAEEFVRLRTSEDPAEYHRAASEEAALEAWFDVIARFPEMRSWVAHNKTVPLEVLERLVDDPDSLVRHTVATKRKLTPDLFNRLVLDEDETVRAALAYNAKVPPAILDRLRNDASALVREAALRRQDR
jgi:hypothetical protein